MRRGRQTGRIGVTGATSGMSTAFYVCVCVWKRQKHICGWRNCLCKQAACNFFHLFFAASSTRHEEALQCHLKVTNKKKEKKKRGVGVACKMGRFFFPHPHLHAGSIKQTWCGVQSDGRLSAGERASICGNRPSPPSKPVSHLRRQLNARVLATV